MSVVSKLLLHLKRQEKSFEVSKDSVHCLQAVAMTVPDWPGISHPRILKSYSFGMSKEPPKQSISC